MLDGSFGQVALLPLRLHSRQIFDLAHISICSDYKETKDHLLEIADFLQEIPWTMGSARCNRSDILSRQHSVRATLVSGSLSSLPFNLSITANHVEKAFPLAPSTGAHLARIRLSDFLRGTGA
jgi:hypothetical protein